eukprot:g19886.t1
MTKGVVGGGVRELAPGLGDVEVSALCYNCASLACGLERREQRAARSVRERLNEGEVWGDGVDPAGLGAGTGCRAGGCRGGGWSSVGDGQSSVGGGQSGVGSGQSGVSSGILNVGSAPGLSDGSGGIRSVDGGSRSGMAGVGKCDAICSVHECFYIKQAFTCTSASVVYCICCSRCGLLYIGETKLGGSETALWSTYA